MDYFSYFIACLVFFVKTNEAARILLVSPSPAISHQMVFRPFIQELLRRGHDVTVITADPAFPKGGAPANLTEIDVHDVSYDIWRKGFFSKTMPNDVNTQINTVIEVMFEVFEGQMTDEKVASLIRDKDRQFDLLILEAYYRPLLLFSHFYKVPVILMSTFGAVTDNLISVGAPMHYLLYQTLARQRLNNLTLWEKAKEMYNCYMFDKVQEEILDKEDMLIRKLYGPDVPSLRELRNNVDMLFLNVFPIFEGIRPMPPNVVHTGGIHQIPEKELPVDLKSYLDSSKNGVIYLSLGTSVDPTVLPPERIQVLVRAASQLPYDVLWKWNDDELPGRTENIRISKWLPQADLLRHPNIKLFITQGGLHSTDEAITAGVPLIGIPLLGDQYLNVERYEYHKIGVRLEFENLTEEKLKNTVLKVIEDDSYRKNIVRLRSLLLDEIQTPMERAMWWTEYVLRHGGAKHLRSPAANISWAEYLELELVLTLLAGLLTSFIVIIMVVRKLYKHVYARYVHQVKVKKT